MELMKGNEADGNDERDLEDSELEEIYRQMDVTRQHSHRASARLDAFTNLPRGNSRRDRSWTDIGTRLDRLTRPSNNINTKLANFGLDFKLFLREQTFRRHEMRKPESRSCVVCTRLSHPRSQTLTGGNSRLYMRTLEPTIYSSGGNRTADGLSRRFSIGTTRRQGRGSNSRSTQPFWGLSDPP
jgi:hypothetical protein